MKKYFAYILPLLLLASCQLRDTSFSWQTDLLTPIAYARITANDAIGDSLLGTGGDDVLKITYRDTISSAFLGETVTFPDTSIDLSVTLDTLTLSSDTIRQRVTMLELGQQLADQGNPIGDLIINNNPANLPAILPTPGLSSGVIDVDASDFFEFAELESGELVITIDNQFPLGLRNVIFSIRNKNLPGPELVLDTFEIIPAGTSVTETYDLSGKEVESELEGELTNLDIDGSLTPVTLRHEDFIELSLVAKNLRAKTATAIFPAQTIVDTIRGTTYNFTGDQEGVELTKFIVQSGRIEAQAISSVQDSIQFFYRLVGATGLDGSNPEISIKLPPAPPGGIITESRIFDLDGFVLDLTADGTTVNTLLEQIKVDLLFSGNLVTLNQEDSVSVSFSLLDLEPVYVEGYIGKNTLELEGKETLDVFGNLDIDKIRLSEVTADIVLANSIGVDAEVVLKDFSARNSQTGERVKLASDQLVAAPVVVAGPDLPDTTGIVTNTISFTPENSNITRFASTLADEIIYDLEVITNYNGQPGVRDNFATDSSRLSAYFDIQLPLAGSVNGLTLADTVAVDWSEVESPEELEEGLFKLLIENEFPIQTVVTATLIDEEGQPITILLKDQVIPAAPLGDDGRTLTPETTIIELELNQEQLNDWLTRAKQVAFRFELDTKPDDTAIRIYADYGITARLTAQFGYGLSN